MIRRVHLGDSLALRLPLRGSLALRGCVNPGGASLFNADLAMTKQFNITERYNVEVRTDWLNAANHPDFSGATIDANINSATFGRVTGGSGARIIVLGARLNW